MIFEARPGLRSSRCASPIEIPSETTLGNDPKSSFLASTVAPYPTRDLTNRNGFSKFSDIFSIFEHFLSDPWSGSSFSLGRE